MRTRRQKRQEEDEEESSYEKRKQPGKTHKVEKGKKFKTTVDARDRILRSREEQMYLLSAFRDDDRWTFEVQGASGKSYFVELHLQELFYVHCYCPDFKHRRKPCKHIYFIITRVAQMEQVFPQYQTWKVLLPPKVVRQLDARLYQRLSPIRLLSREKRKNVDLKDLKDGINCSICNKKMKKKSESLVKCSSCKNFFHRECMRNWKYMSPTCPFCPQCKGHIDILDDTSLGRIQRIRFQPESDIE